jgi:ribosomal protein S14
MGAKALSNAHPKKFYGSKGARRCRVCGEFWVLCVVLKFDIFPCGLVV